MPYSNLLRYAIQTTGMSAAYALFLHLRPLCLCDRYPEIIKFARELLESGQTVPVHENVEVMSYLPGQTAMTTSVQKSVHSMRKNLSRQWQVVAWNTEVLFLLMEFTWKQIVDTT